MTDYYELLGVERDAARDEIKGAYQERRGDADPAAKAELNRAWNVLSDPIQRERYDAKLAAGSSEEDGSEDEAAVPARRATGARPAAARPGARTPLEPTITLPAGMEFATPKARNMALLFDVSVLLVFFLLVQYVGAAVIKDQYPKQVDRIDTLTKQVDRADKDKSKAETAKSKADAAAAKAKRQNDAIAQQAAKAEAAKQATASKAAAAASKKFNKELVKEQAKLQPLNLLLMGIVLVLALAYTVPMSARTGQTFGKRLRHVRLVRVDGSPAGWGASFTHYGVPIAIGLGLSGMLGPLALVLGLGMVLWNLRDRNRQGVHDKLAKTIVVAVPATAGGTELS